jgi:hypothetical protein
LYQEKSGNPDGDQIGRIFTCLGITFFGQFLNYRIGTKFGPTFSQKIFGKHFFLLHLGDFSQNNLVTLLYSLDWESNSTTFIT